MSRGGTLTGCVPQSVATPILYCKVVIHLSSIPSFFRALKINPAHVATVAHLSVRNRLTHHLVKDASLLLWPSLETLGPLDVDEAPRRYMSRFLQQLPALRRVSMHFTQRRAKFDVSAWSQRLQSLQHLALRGRYTTQAFRTISDLPASSCPSTLRSLSVDGNVAVESAKSFISPLIPTLEELDFSGVQRPADQAYLLSLDLPSCHTLGLMMPSLPTVPDLSGHLPSLSTLHIHFETGYGHWRDRCSLNAVTRMSRMISPPEADPDTRPFPKLAVIRLMNCGSVGQLQEWISWDGEDPPWAAAVLFARPRHWRAFFEACDTREIEVRDRSGALLSM